MACTKMTNQPIPQLKDYDVSDTHGFLLVDPLDSLPEYFHPWESAGKNIAKLLVDHQLRNVVDKMPLLDHTRLASYKEQRLAHVFLSFMTNGYVWQEGQEGVVQVLPRQLAIPFCALCDIMGSQWGLSFMAQTLGNYTLRDPEGNVNPVTFLPGGEDSQNVTRVPLQYELEAAPGIKAGIAALECVQNQDEEGLITALEIMTATAINLKNATELMYKYVKPEVFFNVMLPFFTGWDKSSVLPNGLLYEGVSEIPRNTLSANVGMSSVMPTFDAMLGITHEPERQAHLDTVLEVMSTPHRNFILALRKCVPIKELVQSSANDTLDKVYNKCLSAFRDFRSFHIQMFTKFVISQMAKAGDKFGGNEESASRDPAVVSTMQYLKSVRDKTTETSIN